ncbi:MAG: NAD(P)H-dependent oxidoreductase [Planctomycetes bacterium]|nr:NAD(P)H-dependent oxidoreductase [Planctomycetota bacterium]
MPTHPKIVAFAGSAREGSHNVRLLALAVRAARAAGAEVTEVSMRDFPMPLYDAELEAKEGLPEPVRRFKALLEGSDGFLIASPEYNSSITPLLKNAIDWASRPEGKGPALTAFRGKAAALFAASPGSLGGLRGLVHLRAILGNIGVLVLADQVAIPSAHQAFAPDGALADIGAGKRVAALAEALVDLVRRLAARG